MLNLKRFEMEVWDGREIDKKTAIEAVLSGDFQLCIIIPKGTTKGVRTRARQVVMKSFAMEVTTDAVQVHGGNGCLSCFPVERLFREAKVLEIIEGTSQIQQQIIAKYGLRQYRKR